jgi:hypothetical protein
MGEGQRNCYSRGKKKKTEILRTNEKVEVKLKENERGGLKKRRDDGRS